MDPLDNAAQTELGSKISNACRHNELKITIRRPLYASFVALAALKQMEYDLERCATEILEAAIIEHRARQIRHETRRGPKEKAAQLITVIGADNHRLKIPAEVAQKILFIHDSERLNAHELATRFHISTTSVQRILAANGQAVHTHPSTGHNGKFRGKNLVGPLSSPERQP